MSQKVRNSREDSETKNRSGLSTEYRLERRQSQTTGMFPANGHSYIKDFWIRVEPAQYLKWLSNFRSWYRQIRVKLDQLVVHPY